MEKKCNEEYEALTELQQTSAQSASFLPDWKHQEHLQVLESQAHTHVTQLLTTAVVQQQMWLVDNCAKLQPLVQEKLGNRRNMKTVWDLSDRPLKKLWLESPIDGSETEGQ